MHWNLLQWPSYIYICTILHLITVLQSSRSISLYEYYQKYHQYLFYKAKTLWLNCSFWKNTILVWLKYNASTNYQYHLFSNNINMAILQDTENPNHTSKFLKKNKRKKNLYYTELNKFPYFLLFVFSTVIYFFLINSWTFIWWDFCTVSASSVSHKQRTTRNCQYEYLTWFQNWKRTPFYAFSLSSFGNHYRTTKNPPIGIIC